MAKRRRRSNTGIPGLSFSPKRAFGVTKAKRKFAKYTGIPTTKSGRQRKIGKIATGGCLLPIMGVLMAALLVTALLMLLI